MQAKHTMTAWTLFALLGCTLVLDTVAYPQAIGQFAPQYRPPGVPAVVEASNGAFQPSARYSGADANGGSERKFAEKPNALKKVALDDIDEDIQTNQISDGNGFSWTNMLGTLMTMFFNNAAQAGPNKSDDVDTGLSGVVGGSPASPWANLISVGLRIVTSLLGGGAGNDGIDKVDNGGGSPLQVNIIGYVARVAKSVRSFVWLFGLW